MISKIFSLLLAFFVTFSGEIVFAQDINEIDITEGYSEPTFRELYSTIVMMGGISIDDNKVVDEYGRMNYCSLYKEFYSNDFEWNKKRDLIRNNVKEVKDQFRVKYEITQTFLIDRYDFESGYFPIRKDSIMKNLGTMYIFTSTLFERYCDIEWEAEAFPSNVRMNLYNPLTIDKIRISKDNVGKVSEVFDKMYKSGKQERKIYGRIRFTIKNVPGYMYNIKKTISGVLVEGSIDSVDFYYDENMTHKIENVDGYN